MTTPQDELVAKYYNYDELYKRFITRGVSPAEADEHAKVMSKQIASGRIATTTKELKAYSMAYPRYHNEL